MNVFQGLLLEFPVSILFLMESNTLKIVELGPKVLLI